MAAHIESRPAHITKPNEFNRAQPPPSSPAAGCEHPVTNARFARTAGQVRNRGILVPLLNDVFSQKTTKEWVAILEQAAVHNGPFNSIAEAFGEIGHRPHRHSRQ